MRFSSLHWCSVITLAFVASARLAAQTDVDRDAARNVAEILAAEHYTKKPLDKSLSAVWLKMMLRQVDPMKSHFQKSDIAEFDKRKDDYAEFLHKGDFEPALAIHHRFQQRVKDRLATIRQLLKEDLDPKNEALAPMPTFDKATWPATDAEVRATWRKRLRYEMLVLKAEGYSAKDAADVLERRYVRSAGIVAGLSDEQAVEAAICLLAISYDSRSSYQSEATVKKMTMLSRKQYQGIGVVIQEREGAVVITKITPKGPADLDGKLRPGNTIVGVDPDGTDRMRDVVGASAADVTGLLRGAPNTAVRLEVVSPGKGKRTSVFLKRGKVDFARTRSEIVEIPGPDRKIRVGYVIVPAFFFEPGTDGYHCSTDDILAAFERPGTGFLHQNVDVVLFDMRFTEGGPFNQYAVVNKFLEHGRPIYTEKESGGPFKRMTNPGTDPIWEGPIVVLTSRQTRGPAEIFVAGLKSYGRSLVIGEATGGNGLAQMPFDIVKKQRYTGGPVPLGFLLVTTKQLGVIEGAGIHTRGVRPNIELPWLIDSENQNPRGPNELAPFDAGKPPHFDVKAPRIEDATIKMLTERSKKRQMASREFAKHLSDVAEFRKIVEAREKGITAEQLAPLSTLRALDAELIRRIETTEGIRRDFYMEEVLAIVQDFMTAKK